MKEKYKEIVISGKIETIYTVKETYKRYDGEILANCQITCNNISPKGVVPNDCGIFYGIALKVLKGFKRVN